MTVMPTIQRPSTMADLQTPAGGAGGAGVSVSAAAFSLPTMKLVAGVVMASAAVAGGWMGLAAMGVFEAWERSAGGAGSAGEAGVAGTAVVLVMVLAGIAILMPWKRRESADWMLWWMGATVFRVLVTPIAAYLLYSAPFAGWEARPFALAVGLAYLATLFTEAAILARSVNAELYGRSVS